MARVTGQEVIRLGVKRAGGGAQLAKATRLHDVVRTSDPGAHVRRWARDGTPQFGDVILNVLVYLDALNWDALAELRSQDAIEAAVESSKRRTEYLENLLGEIGEPPSADPGTP